MFSASATTPSAAKAASPWMRRGTTASVSCTASPAGGLELTDPGHPGNHRVHEFQVAGIRHQLHIHRLPRAERVGGAGPVVVLSHLRCPGRGWPSSPASPRRPRTPPPAPAWGMSMMWARTLSPSPVGHPQDHGLPPIPGRLLQRQVDHGDQHVVPLQGEALLSQVGPVEGSAPAPPPPLRRPRRERRSSFERGWVVGTGTPPSVPEPPHPRPGPPGVRTGSRWKPQ